MQQNNYVEAEDAYRRALAIAPDNNKMCNLGICLMKQGRLGEAKETLRLVKPAVADGPRGVDSHLKAYERAQQMLGDLKSEMMNSGGDRVEQRKLFDAFLGSSAIWQPQPCKEHMSALNPSKIQDTSKTQDGYANENVNSNIVSNGYANENMNSNIVSNGKTLVIGNVGNSLNIDAKPFYVSMVKGGENVIGEGLKRSRSGNHADNVVENKELGNEGGNKARRKSENEEDWTEVLPDSKDFEEAIIAAVLGSSAEPEKMKLGEKGTVKKRLKVFQDITQCVSPRA